MHIYFVEDDKSISYIIDKTIKNSGYEVTGFENGKDFLKALESHLPNLILLDVMLPDISGFDLIPKIRRFYKDLPIIMISALNNEMDKVKALDLGADDYIVKPFGVLELVSRINVHIRKMMIINRIEKDNLIIDKELHKCFINGEEVYLTSKEFDILYLLIKNENKVVSKETLFNEIWQMELDIATRTLDMHIKSLRTKIKSANFQIKTIRGVGYTI